MQLKVDIDPEQVYTRKTDSRGRFSLPTSQFKECEVKIVVVED